MQQPYTAKQHSRAVRPTDIWDQNVRRTPIPHSRTVRYEDVAVVTSGFGGKLVPIKMIPLLREDRANSSRVTVNFQMSETAQMLINPVRATAVAYLVPKLAFERFKDLGTINRSYNGQPEIDDTVVKWFETVAYDPAAELWQKLGLHGAVGDNVNTDYIEAYNAVWNYIATQRSTSLTQRTALDTTLAPAFWEHTQLQHVKPTFDDAMMEGIVPLEFIGTTSNLPLKSVSSAAIRDGAGTVFDRAPSLGENGQPPTDPNGNQDWTGKIWAELAENSVQVSLANIDLARETAAWARMRTQYQGLDEDWMMDQLLSGVALPEEMMRHPILLDHQDMTFGMTQRYATDGANLETSVTDGQTSVTLNIRTPQVNTGGVIVIAAQVLPSQLYERRMDHYFHAVDVEELPMRTADELDPQPVSIVQNKEVDVLHSTPDDVFGYEPLNAKWMRTQVNVGGKYFRNSPTGPFDEDRNRIWDTNVVDPQLGPDFYLSTTIKHDVFASSNSDPFEIWCSGRVGIDGLTYFGPVLRESTDDYQKVLDQVETSRIDPDPGTPS